MTSSGHTPLSTQLYAYASGCVGTGQHAQALDDLTAPWLHGDPVSTHQQREHDQGHKLAGVCLQDRGRESGGKVRGDV